MKKRLTSLVNRIRRKELDLNMNLGFILEAFKSLEQEKDSSFYWRSVFNIYCTIGVEFYWFNKKFSAVAASRIVWLAHNDPAALRAEIKAIRSEYAYHEDKDGQGLSKFHNFVFHKLQPALMKQLENSNEGSPDGRMNGLITVYKLAQIRAPGYARSALVEIARQIRTTKPFDADRVTQLFSKMKENIRPEHRARLNGFMLALFKVYRGKDRRSLEDRRHGLVLSRQILRCLTESKLRYLDLKRYKKAILEIEKQLEKIVEGIEELEAKAVMHQASMASAAAAKMAMEENSHKLLEAVRGQDCPKWVECVEWIPDATLQGHGVVEPIIHDLLNNPSLPPQKKLHFLVEVFSSFRLVRMERRVTLNT